MQICSAIRPAIRSASSAAIISAFCARAVAGPLLGQLFPVTAPGVTNPGFAIDYSDLTEEKLAWRKNLFSETEFRNGVADAPSRSAGITATTMDGYAGAIGFPVSATTSEYAYKTVSLPQGTPVGASIMVEMGDDLGPPMVGGNTPGVDASFVLGGAALSTSAVQVVPQGGRRYLLRVPLLGVLTTVASYGIVRYANNSTRTLKVTAYMLNLGTLQPYQMLTDVSTEFLAAFPYHLLYRDNFGLVACYQLEDPCGLALDGRFGGARNTAESWVGAPTSLQGGWVDNGDGSYTNSGVTGLLGWSTGKLITGRMYEAKIRVVARTAGSLNLPYDGAGSNISTAVQPGTYSRFFVAGSSGLYIYGINFAGTVDRITVREVYGDHAVQSTAGDRPVISAKYNLLTNSAWQGGGVLPTGWGSVGSSGLVAANGITADGSIIYRFTASSERPFFTQNASAPLGAAGMQSGSVYVEQIHSGSAAVSQVVTWVNIPSGAVQTFFKNGAIVSSGTLVAVGDRVGALITGGGTVGTATFRTGLGTGGTVTADISLSSPLITVGGPESIGRYQRVNSDGTYDYAGFPIGARFNGINSWMQIPTSSLAGRSKLVLAASFRKDADPTTAVDQALLEVGTSYATVAGRMVLCTAVAGNTQTGAYVRGSASTVGATVAAPTPSNSVVVACVDWTTGAPQRAVRRNGVFIGGTPGTGVGGDGAVVDAQPIFIGRRGGTGTALNGVIYRAFGYGVDFADRYGQVEGWLNDRTKVAQG